MSKPTAESVELEIVVDVVKALEYIRTKPLHHSQKIKGNKIFYDLKSNYEFETKLFEFADRITILRPIELKRKIVDRACKILKKYK